MKRTSNLLFHKKEIKPYSPKQNLARHRLCVNNRTRNMKCPKIFRRSKSLHQKTSRLCWMSQNIRKAEYKIKKFRRTPIMLIRTFRQWKAVKLGQGLWGMINCRRLSPSIFKVRGLTSYNLRKNRKFFPNSKRKIIRSLQAVRNQSKIKRMLIWKRKSQSLNQSIRKRIHFAKIQFHRRNSSRRPKSLQKKTFLKQRKRMISKKIIRINLKGIRKMSISKDRSIN